MNRKRPPQSPELVTVGVLPLQSFVSPLVEVPPGTPARARPDRPPFAPTGPSTDAGNENAAGESNEAEAGA
jgi:hypothetical protein